MSRIIAFVLRAGGAVGGAFAGLQISPETLTGLLATAGVGPETGLTPDVAVIALCAVGGLLGLLVGSFVAGLLPDVAVHPVGTRQDAARSVPRLRRHLAEGHGKPKTGGSPLDRLSAPPAGQRLPPHDLSHIPPAPKDDEITFERIPNTGFYADIESPVNFDDDDDEDLERFAAARAISDDAPHADTGEGAEWGDDDWGRPGDMQADEPAAKHDATPPASDPEPVLQLPPEATAEEEWAAIPEQVSQAREEQPETHSEEPDDETAVQPASFEPQPAHAFAAQPAPEPEPASAAWEQPQREQISNRRDTGHDGYSAPRFASGLTGGMENDWFAGEADEEEDADDDGAGYGSLMAIGLGKTHKPQPKAPSHRLGEANLSPMPLLDGERDSRMIPQGAGPQDFRLREALEELKRI